MTKSIIEIPKSEFDAICYARNAGLMPVLEELKFYRDEQGQLYGVIARDRADGDYGAVLFGRDRNKRFRAIEGPTKFHETPDEAFVELVGKFSKSQPEEDNLYPQGDEKGRPNELYEIVAKESQIHKSFIQLTGDANYISAKAFIGEAVYAYVDVDGNYVKDFQSTGFNARLWELYLFIFFMNQGFEFDNSFKAPDYLIDKFGRTIALEATTVNVDNDLDEVPPKNEGEVFKLWSDYMPIKFGSPLYSKLKKRYWELDQVKGKPLIFAIHDYHMGEPLHWASHALRSYLFGYSYKTILRDGVIHLALDVEGQPIPEEIERHVYKHKNIPSNFFSQPDAENISAVLFCNNATLDTFNRFGKLAKLGGEGNSIHRVAYVNDLTNLTYTPKVIVDDVEGIDYHESWGDTMCLFHNPRAKYPIELNLFSGISQCFFDMETKRYYGPRQTPEFLKSINKYKA